MMIMRGAERGVLPEPETHAWTRNSEKQHEMRGGTNVKRTDNEIVTVVNVCHRVVSFDWPRPRPCTVEVLNPRCRMAASRSAFCTGFEM